MKKTVKYKWYDHILVKKQIDKSVFVYKYLLVCAQLKSSGAQTHTYIHIYTRKDNAWDYIKQATANRFKYFVYHNLFKTRT